LADGEWFAAGSGLYVVLGLFEFLAGFAEVSGEFGDATGAEKQDGGDQDDEDSGVVDYSEHSGVLSGGFGVVAPGPAGCIGERDWWPRRAPPVRGQLPW
jgi:hypothetical protein